MGGKVNSTTNDIKKYEWNGYHKQGSIEDENFLNLSEKLEKIQESTDSQTSALSQDIQNINTTCKDMDGHILTSLQDILTVLNEYREDFSQITRYLNNINISINGGNE